MADANKRYGIILDVNVTGNVLSSLKKVSGAVKKTMSKIRSTSVGKVAGAISKTAGKTSKDIQRTTKKAPIEQRRAGRAIRDEKRNLNYSETALKEHSNNMRKINEQISYSRDKLARQEDTGESTKATKKEIKNNLRKRAAISSSMRVKKDEIGQSEGIINASRREQIANQSGWQTLRMNTKEHGNYVKSGGKFNRVNSKLVSKTRMLTQGMKGFKMEMLGVMFFGMNLQKTFGGMVTPALQLVGALDILRMTFELLYLPIALIVLDGLLPISEFFVTLPEEAQVLIGALTLLTAGLGLLLFVLGSTALGVGSLMALFAGIYGTATTAGAGVGVFTTGLTAIGGAIGGVAALLSALLLPIALIIGALIILWVAWQENFAKIQQFADEVFNALVAIFDGLVEVFKGALDIIFGLIELDGDKIMKGFGEIFSGLYKIVVDGVGMIIVSFVAFTARVVVETGKLVIAVLAWFFSLPLLVLGILAKVVGMFVNFVADLFEQWGWITKDGKKAFTDLVDGIVSIFDDLPGKIFAVIDGIVHYIDDSLGGSLSGIGDFLENPVGNTIEGAAGLIGLASGGIVRRPTIAMVGEAGPEAVIPLREMNNMGGSTVYNTVNVDAVVSSDVDIQELADRVNKELQWDYRRSTMR